MNNILKVLLVFQFIFFGIEDINAQYDDYYYNHFPYGYRNDDIIYGKNMYWHFGTDTIMKSYPIYIDSVNNEKLTAYITRHGNGFFNRNKHIKDVNELTSSDTIIAVFSSQYFDEYLKLKSLPYIKILFLENAENTGSFLNKINQRGQRIEEIRFKNGFSLKKNGEIIKEIFAELLKVKNLTSLNLYDTEYYVENHDLIISDLICFFKNDSCRITKFCTQIEAYKLISLLPHLDKLKELTIISNYINDKEKEFYDLLYQLENIEKLRIHGFSIKYLDDRLKNMKNLRELIIKHEYKTRDSIIDISKFAPNLEELHLIGFEGDIYESIKGLNKLKILTVDIDDFVDDYDYRLYNGHSKPYDTIYFSDKMESFKNLEYFKFRNSQNIEIVYDFDFSKIISLKYLDLIFPYYDTMYVKQLKQITNLPNLIHFEMKTDSHLSSSKILKIFFLNLKCKFKGYNYYMFDYNIKEREKKKKYVLIDGSYFLIATSKPKVEKHSKIRFYQYHPTKKRFVKYIQNKN
jgi:predicted phosphatase